MSATVPRRKRAAQLLIVSYLGCFSIPIWFGTALAELSFT
jgi:hypothetical protein